MYHLSNGMGLGLVYATVVSRPRLSTAVLWGLLLEGAMLTTPYAEVFGYKLSQGFLAISLGAHVVYGITLWGALRSWLRGHAFEYSPKQPPRRLVLTCVLVPLGISAIAADFHQRHAKTIPPSPPSYLGSHLYTTWDALEPDRLAALWILKTFC